MSREVVQEAQEQKALAFETQMLFALLRLSTEMTTSAAWQTSRLLLLRRVVIWILAGLLIFYHSVTLYDLYLDADAGMPTTFDNIQSVFRVVITLSLLLVVFGRRWALWGMWAGISALVATHYWAYFGDLPVDFTEGRHPLSYLKGFIFPTIITLAFPSSTLISDPIADA